MKQKPENYPFPNVCVLLVSGLFQWCEMTWGIFPLFLFPGRCCMKQMISSLKVWEYFCLKPSEPSVSLWEYFKILL